MGEKSKPAPFRVGDKVNLAKSTDVSVGTGVGVKSVLFREDGKVNLSKSTDVSVGSGVGVEKAPSKQKQLKKKRFSFCKLFVDIIDILDTLFMSFTELDAGLIGFTALGIVVLVLIGWCLLSMWLEDLFGEGGRAWAFGITIPLTLVNLSSPFIIHALHIVLHRDKEENENRGY